MKIFCFVFLRLYTEFQTSTAPETRKTFVVVWWVVCKPFIVFSLAQAEQYLTILSIHTQGVQKVLLGAVNRG